MELYTTDDGDGVVSESITVSNTSTYYKCDLYLVSSIYNLYEQTLSG